MTALRLLRTRQKQAEVIVLARLSVFFFYNIEFFERIHETRCSTSVPWYLVKTFRPRGAVPEPPELTASSLKDEPEDSSWFKVGGQWSFGLVTPGVPWVLIKSLLWCPTSWIKREVLWVGSMSAVTILYLRPLPVRNKSCVKRGWHLW